MFLVRIPFRMCLQNAGDVVGKLGILHGKIEKQINNLRIESEAHILEPMPDGQKIDLCLSITAEGLIKNLRVE